MTPHEIALIALNHARCRYIVGGWTCGTPGPDEAPRRHALTCVDAAITATSNDYRRAITTHLDPS